MVYREVNIGLGKIVLDDSNEEENLRASLRKTCFRSLIFFRFNFCSFHRMSLVAYGKIIFRNFVTIQLWSGKFV